MEKFKLSFHEPEYFINREKNSVTCKVEYELKGNPQILLWFQMDTVYADVPGRFHDIAIATAKLDPQDTFDLEKGMSVARAKAESQAYQMVKHWMTNVADKWANKVARSFAEFICKADRVKRHNDEYISKF